MDDCSSKSISLLIMAIKREEILLALQSALLGAIYPSIRAIVFKYDPSSKYFMLRSYLDREPNEDDFERASIVNTEFMASFKFSDFDKVEQECIRYDGDISKLDILDGMIYLRSEGALPPNN
jgi:hypothetical protein